jgi:hypothetical protein
MKQVHRPEKNLIHTINKVTTDYLTNHITIFLNAEDGPSMSFNQTNTDFIVSTEACVR